MRLARGLHGWDCWNDITSSHLDEGEICSSLLFSFLPPRSVCLYLDSFDKRMCNSFSGWKRKEEEVLRHKANNLCVSLPNSKCHCNLPLMVSEGRREKREVEKTREMGGKEEGEQGSYSETEPILPWVPLYLFGTAESPFVKQPCVSAGSAREALLSRKMYPCLRLLVKADRGPPPPRPL